MPCLTTEMNYMDVDMLNPVLETILLMNTMETVDQREDFKSTPRLRTNRNEFLLSVYLLFLINTNVFYSIAMIALN